MLETLQHWDATLFQCINGSLSNPVFDAVLPWCREKWFWVPVYLFVVAFSLLNFTTISFGKTVLKDVYLRNRSRQRYRFF